MKRFAIAGMLTLAMMPQNAFATSPFDDIDPQHWAYPKIKFLYDHGIIRGKDGGKFNGNERISRYEAAALLYQALQYTSRMQSQGGSVDADVMDTINSLMTELTDEMQVIEVRIEENSDAIAMLKNQLASMHGKPTQGFSVPMGSGGGRLKFMGQAMVSLVSGGANSAYSGLAGSNSGAVIPATANPGSGKTEFINDYVALAMAADIDEKTSFFAKANLYTGGDAGAGPGGDSDLEFNDYMYIHVRDLWSDWDLTVGRMGLPWGHEVAGAFRTNPYFVSNSMVDQFYGNNQVTGVYFSTESDDGEWNWGIGIHNGDMNNPAGLYSHLYPVAAIMGQGVSAMGAANINVGVNGVNDNEDDSFGYILHLGSRSTDGDFKWDLNYFTNGGKTSVNPAAGIQAVAGYGAMSFINLGADYRINHDWQLSAEYVTGNLEQDLLLSGRTVAGNPEVIEDDFTTWYLQIVYNLDSKSTLGLRMGEHSYDGVGARNAAQITAQTPVSKGTAYKDEISEMVFAYSRKVSDNGTLLVELANVDYDLLNGRTKSDIYGAANSKRDDFDTVRASYRIDF